MKLSRRFITMMLAVVMIVATFGVVPMAADFTDLPESHASFEAVNVLSKLGVINGYEENGSFNFKPDNNVTRAEFTAMLLRTRGMGSLGSMSLENPPFPDVVTPDVSWAIGNIRTAREMGIINGYDDGTFLPNNNVLYEEAVKMIVCALGYGEMGAEGAQWYSRYLMTATSLGFLDGSGGVIGVPATRATIANMLYNCLEVKLAENNTITDKTILEDDLGLIKNVGYIDSNPQISLSKPDANLRANEVQINAPGENGVNETLTYKVDDASKYSDMLGAQITFYYTIDRDSSFNNLVMATVKNSKIIEIEATDIYDSTTSTIEYLKNEKDDKTTTVSIASDSVVVYNDKLYGADKATSSYAEYYRAKSSKAMPTIGKVKLLDRDNDNNYDVVFIDSYDAWIVSAKTTSNYTIVDNVLRKGLTDPANKIVLDPEKVKFTDASGKGSSFDAITTKSVICVKQSSGIGSDILTSVVVCDKPVTGAITATSSSQGYTIGDKTYKVSAQAPWKNAISGAKPDTTIPTRGDNGRFYLDCNGNILAFEKSETVSNQQYGYLTSAGIKELDFDRELQLYISTKSNIKGSLYTVTEKTKLNGSIPATLEDFLTGLEAGKTYPGSSNDTYAQIVKFTTKSGNKIDEILTADREAGGKEILADKLYLYDGDVSNDVYKYDTTSRQLIRQSDKAKIYVGSSFIIKAPESKSNRNDYKTISTNDFSASTEYKVEFYDVTKTNSAKVVVVYSGKVSVGEVKVNSPVLLITEISNEMDDSETGSRYTLKGYVGKTESEYKLSNEDSATVTMATKLQKGDMVRLGTDEDGYTVKPEHLIFSLKEDYRDEAITHKPNAGSYPKHEEMTGNIYKVFWGSSYQYDDERLLVSEDVLETVDSYTNADGTAKEVATHPIVKGAFASTQFLEIDARKNDPEIKDITADGYENVLRSLLFAENGNIPTEVFIHMTSEKSVKTMVIVRR